MAHLQSIVYKPKNAPAPESGYLRIPLQRAELVPGYGIEGDAKGGGNRQLNVMTSETVQRLGEEGFSTAVGQMGEQLMISGLDIDRLEPGDRVSIGESAIIEITEPRTGCAKFERHQDRLRTEAAGRMGMMARVITGGTINLGDEVTAVSHQAAS